MRVLRGMPISGGYARGNAFVYGKMLPVVVPRYEIAPREVQGEHQRFHEALDRSWHELKEVEQKVLAELGRAESEIFSAHLAMLKDEHFIAKVKERTERDLVNVEQALDAEVTDLAVLISQVEDEYLRERIKDVEDVQRRVMRHLGHDATETLTTVPPNSVIVAHELLPSDTVKLDRRHVVAIVTERGGSTGHAAILARAQGIPAVTGIDRATGLISSGSQLLVDGEKGTVTVEPSHEEAKRFSVARARYDWKLSEVLAEEAKECVTLDGVHIKLLANIGRPEEVDQILEHNLEGIGLFRTEYLFLDSPEAPTVDEQLEVYGEVIRKLPGLPVTIRTADLGGDKMPSFMGPRLEKNPNLGVRGLRFSLLERDMLRTQLLAILEAADEADVRVLFPMILGESDLREAVEELRAVAAEAGKRKVPRVGAMIETPSSLFELDGIFDLVEFASIGTNDLVQFMLAADRGEIGLVDADSVLHPAVVRAIARVTEVGKGKGRSVSVCGEAAGNPRVACLLVGLGVRELSMSPVRAARVRHIIRNSTLVELQETAREALESRDEGEVVALLRNVCERK